MNPRAMGRQGAITDPNYRDHRLEKPRRTRVESEPDDRLRPRRLTFYPADRPLTRTAWIDAPLEIAIPTEECR